MEFRWSRKPGNLILNYNRSMGRVKRICVFEHSVMTNFNWACPAIHRGHGSGFLSEGSSWLTACMSEQRRFWRYCADAQARLNLRCSHRRKVPNSLDAAPMKPCCCYSFIFQQNWGPNSWPNAGGSLVSMCRHSISDSTSPLLNDEMHGLIKRWGKNRHNKITENNSQLQVGNVLLTQTGIK